MAGQAPDTGPDTVSNLDKCVKIAEKSSLKLLNDPYWQSNPIPYYKRVKTKDDIAREGFPKFRQLPAELRSKVWESAMPPYGVYTALMLGREEPKPQQPPLPAPMAFRLSYRLEPVPLLLQGDELRMRLDTMRAIQRTSSEAASEVQRAFPTTINCTGGKLRFNAEHDTLSLSDAHCQFRERIYWRFKRYSQGAVAFAHDWHTIPRRMMFNNRRLWWLLHGLTMITQMENDSQVLALDNPPHDEFVDGFLDFLSDCTGLKSFGFMFDRPWPNTTLNPSEVSRSHYKYLHVCYPAPIMRGPFYVREEESMRGGLQVFVEGLRALEAHAHAPRPGQGFQDGLEFRRPELQNLEFEAMVPVRAVFHVYMRSTEGGAPVPESKHLLLDHLDAPLDSLLES